MGRQNDNVGLAAAAAPSGGNIEAPPPYASSEPYMAQGSNGIVVSPGDQMQFNGVEFNRKATNVCMAVSFGLCLLTWAIAGAVAAGSANYDMFEELDHKNEETHQWYVEKCTGGTYIPTTDIDVKVNVKVIVERGVVTMACAMLFAFIMGLAWLVALMHHPKIMVFGSFCFACALYTGLIVLGVIINVVVWVVIGAICVAIILMVMIFFRRRMHRTANLFQQSVKILNDNRGLLVMSCLGSILKLLLSTLNIYWIIAGYMNGSITCDRNCESDTSNYSNRCHWSTSTFGTFTIIFAAYFQYWLIWMILNTQLFIAAGVGSIWYFHGDDESRNTSQNTRRVTSWSVLQSGTIAISALIMAIVEAIRDAARRRSGGGAGALVACILLAILNCVAEFLTRFTTIGAAITGLGFIDSAKFSFKILKERGLSLFVVDRMAKIVCGMTALAVAGITGGITWGIVHSLSWSSDTDRLVWSILCTVIAVVFAMFVFHVFTSLALNLVDTVYFCYAVDRESTRTQILFGDELANLFASNRAKKGEYRD